jgi:hypothetical protein
MISIRRVGKVKTGVRSKAGGARVDSFYFQLVVTAAMAARRDLAT